MELVMELGADELDRYLRRLGLDAPPAPGLAALTGLMARHMEAVPFENLDIADRRPFALSTRHALDKVIARHRGGFCCEVNEAFRVLLSTLGFAVRRIEGQVWVEAEARYGSPFDHLALVVMLDGAEWLVDVGFGDSNRAPLRLPDGETADVSGHYRLAPGNGAGELVLERVRGADGQDAPKPLYRVTTPTRALEDFAAMCRHHQSSPESFFTQGLICTRATPRGRLTLTSDRLIETDAGQRRERAVGSAERDGLLVRLFGLPRPVSDEPHALPEVESDIG